MKTFIKLISELSTAQDSNRYFEDCALTAAWTKPCNSLVLLDTPTPIQCINCIFSIGSNNRNLTLGKIINNEPINKNT